MLQPVRQRDPSAETALDSIARARHFFVDWDGCLVERGVLRPGAHRFLRLVAGRVSVVSNNSTDTPRSLAGLLHQQGIDLAPEQFFLAGDLTLRLAAERFGRTPVYLLANLAMEEHARALGLRLGRQSAREVILLRDTRFSFAKLEKAVNLLRGGARLMVANPDVTHPRGSEVAPETGALLAAITSCLDPSRLDVAIVGKPGPTLFEAALAASCCTTGEVVMIGDGPLTDIAGADRAGIPSVLLDEAHGLTLGAVAQVLLPRRR